MASGGQIKGHVQKQIAGAVSVAAIFFIVKFMLKRAGRPDLAADF